MLGRRGRRFAADTPQSPPESTSSGTSVGTDQEADRSEVRGRTRRRVVAALMTGASLIVLFAPADDVPSDLLPGTDKVVHVLLFAGLAFALRRAGARVGWLAPALLAYAVVSELVQASPALGRSASGWDALADAVGLASGLLVARLRTGEGGPTR